MSESLLRFDFWRKVWFRWNGALCWERGAAMAFFALFSIAPLFVLLLSLLDRLFGVDVVRGEIYATLVRALGPQTAEAMRALLLQPSLFQGGRTVIVFNAVLTAIGSAALFRHMQRCLAILWQQTESEGRGPIAYVRGFIRSFFAVGALGVFVVGGLLVLAMAILTGPVLKQQLLGNTFPSFWSTLVTWLALVGATGIFIVLYLTLAPERPSLRRLSVAALCTFLSLIVMKLVVGFYAQGSSLFSLFGAGSAVVYLLLWCFLLAQVFLFAAVVAAVRTER
ncbi:YihY/virulence factor BrkB family protein [Patescibacteria group bacterium]|nr:YihY/virulence factor BrkB family protein [Patescibacteria group bacterium]